MRQRARNATAQCHWAWVERVRFNVCAEQHGRCYGEAWVRGEKTCCARIINVGHSSARVLAAGWRSRGVRSRGGETFRSEDSGKLQSIECRPSGPCMKDRERQLSGIPALNQGGLGPGIDAPKVGGVIN